MAKVRTIKLSLGERLRESKRLATSMMLPMAVHQRLDVLADLAQDMKASRAEIVAMLIADAPADEGELERRLMAYRKKTVGEVLLDRAHADTDTDEGGDVVELPVRTPGRPRRKDAG